MTIRDSHVDGGTVVADVLVFFYNIELRQDQTRAPVQYNATTYQVRPRRVHRRGVQMAVIDRLLHAD